MKSMRMPRLAAQARVTALMYSGPLSHRIASGLPRHSMIRSSEHITRSDGSEKSTSIPKPSRLKSSITLNRRMLRPSATWPILVLQSFMRAINDASMPPYFARHRTWRCRCRARGTAPVPGCRLWLAEGVAFSFKRRELSTPSCAKRNSGAFENLGFRLSSLGPVHVLPATRIAHAQQPQRLFLESYIQAERKIMTIATPGVKKSMSLVNFRRNLNPGGWYGFGRLLSNRIFPIAMEFLMPTPPTKPKL
jgi:hypothetical protein